MASDPAILFVKPKAISADDKAALTAAGVIVVEIKDPANVKFMRAGVEIDSTSMLRAAAEAIQKSEIAMKAFGCSVCDVLQRTNHS